jgi:hypothetical protein
LYSSRQSGNWYFHALYQEKATPHIDPEDSPIVADFIRSPGNAGIGARLRLVSERIDREVNVVYAHAGLHFEQRWI